MILLLNSKTNKERSIFILATLNNLSYFELQSVGEQKFKDEIKIKLEIFNDDYFKAIKKELDFC